MGMACDNESSVSPNNRRMCLPPLECIRTQTNADASGAGVCSLQINTQTRSGASNRNNVAHGLLATSTANSTTQTSTTMTLPLTSVIPPSGWFNASSTSGNATRDLVIKWSAIAFVAADCVLLVLVARRRLSKGARSRANKAAHFDNPEFGEGWSCPSGSACIVEHESTPLPLSETQ